MALVGQLQSYLNIGVNLTGLGFNNGLIKYTSQFQNCVQRQHLFFSTSLIATVVTSVLLALISFIFSTEIAEYIFNNEIYEPIIRLSGIYFLTTATVNLFTAFLNGRQELKRFIKVNILLTISSFFTALIALYFFKLHGLLYAQIFLSSSTFFIVLSQIIGFCKSRSISFSKAVIKRLSGYSLMAIVSGTLAPLSLFLIRRIIATNLSWEHAGLWDGINKVSNNYIMLLTMSFSYYFLPTFSRLINNREIKIEVTKSLKTIIPILCIGACVIFISRNLIIQLLFSSEFTNMKSLFIWQVIGDFFKIISWVFGYLFIAREKTRLFIITEVTSVALQIVLAKLFISINLPINLYYGVENFLYALIMYICYKRVFK